MQNRVRQTSLPAIIKARNLLLAAAVAASAAAAQAGTKLVSASAPVRVLVPTDNSLGASWIAPGFDDSSWRKGTNGVGYEAVHGAYQANVLADSEADWSRGGNQGENNWFNGYYNLTLDADHIYQPGDFIPFPKAAGPWGPNNFWDGSAWNWNPDPAPWDTIGETFVHPNGFNSGGQEHWVIRRWRSTESGPVTFLFSLRKDCLAGSGVTGKILVNGVEIFSRAIGGGDSLGFMEYVPATVTAGDVVDFVQTPMGADGDPGDGCDGSKLTARVLAGNVNPVITDSASGWAGGVQGAADWYWGFYNASADGDGIYNPLTDFNNTDPNWIFTGCWELGPGNPPWDTICQFDIHPNGINNGAEHWVIRDWENATETDLPVRTVAHVHKANPNGSGVTHHTIINGQIVRSDVIGGGDRIGITGIAEGQLPATGYVDFALSPIGPGGATDDGADGSVTWGRVERAPSLLDCIHTDVQSEMYGVTPTVYLRYPFTIDDPASLSSLKLKIKYNDGFTAYLNGSKVAARNNPTIPPAAVVSSVDDWVPAAQGANNWRYGYYDKSLDPDGTYQAADFTEFPHDGAGWSPTDFWSGSQWDWFNGNPPWTEIGQTTGHPNHPNGGAVDPGNPGTHEQWVIRRWECSLFGDYRMKIRFFKTNPNCGDGVVVKVFRSGVEIYSQGIAGNDATGRDDTIDLPGIEEGEVFDIALTPGAANDFCDGSYFSAAIVDSDPPVPFNTPAPAPRLATGVSEVPVIIDLTDQIGLLIATPGAAGGGIVIPSENILAIHGANNNISDRQFIISAELIGNRRPVTTPDLAGVAVSTTLVCPTAGLVANDTDPDGDPLFVTGVNFGTPAGGFVTLMGDTLTYSPPLAFTGEDTITYNVSDNSDGVTEGTLRVIVGEVRIVSIARTPGGATLKLQGIPNAPYEVLRAEDVVNGPWTVLNAPGSNADAAGTLTVEDAAAPARAAFYRARLATTK